MHQIVKLHYKGTIAIQLPFMCNHTVITKSIFTILSSVPTDVNTEINFLSKTFNCLLHFTYKQVHVNYNHSGAVTWSEMVISTKYTLTYIVNNISPRTSIFGSPFLNLTSFTGPKTESIEDSW